MIFQSWTFMLFFAIFLVVFYGIRKFPMLRVSFLVLAAYVFYGWLAWCIFYNWLALLYPVLMIYITVVNWFCVRRMEGGNRKLWLGIAVTLSLLVLCFFKYTDFLIENINMAFNTELPPLTSLPKWKWAMLPAGLSFFTFQGLSYAIDAYRGEVKPEPNIIRFAAYISLFTNVLSGPIERASNMLPQIERVPRITMLDVTDGASLFLVGMFKKVVMADWLDKYVSTIYPNAASHNTASLVAATFAYTWQIYFDFAGYTDMARGVARLMGFKIILNFNNPYTATDLGDFWGRWHISLSSWIKDYLYIPLGGNRKGPARMYFNIFVAMVLSGIWHGAGWLYIVWGALHAFGRMITREAERTAFYRDRVPRFCKQLLVFAFVMVTWIFFKVGSMPSGTLKDAWDILKRICSSSWLADPRLPLLPISFVLMIWIYQFVYNSKVQKLLQPAPVRVALAVIMIVCLFVCQQAPAKFIYTNY
ncbi:MBOAT family protein [bacterium]|nr:MBOAT family protein [bacterium]